MDAQRQIAALHLRVSSAEAALDRARAEATTAWRALAEEEDARVEERKVQRAATVAAMEAAEAVCRRQLHASRMRELDTVISHDVELRELRRGHAEELAAAVAAATAAATAAEAQRLRMTVGPVLHGLQKQQDEVDNMRTCIWDLMDRLPPKRRPRLG
jgi:hypothetical protein